jgi:hypothetical protein
MKPTRLSQHRLHALTAVCRICGRRRARAFLRRCIYGYEWECRDDKGCDAVFWDRVLPGARHAP